MNSPPYVPFALDANQPFSILGAEVLSSGVFSWSKSPNLRYGFTLFDPSTPNTQFSLLGALAYGTGHVYPYNILFRQELRGVLMFDANAGQYIVVGAFVWRIGPSYFPPPTAFPIVPMPFPPPVTITGAPVPPGQQFTTADGTIQGVVDGVNRVFQISVYLHRAQIFVNGIAQTLNYDCAFGGLAVVFRKGSIPAAGSLITIIGYANW